METRVLVFMNALGCAQFHPVGAAQGASLVGAVATGKGTKAAGNPSRPLEKGGVAVILPALVVAAAKLAAFVRAITPGD